MGNTTSYLRHTGTLGEFGDDTKAIDNSKSALPAMSSAGPGHAGNGLIIDQPDSSTRSREYSEKQEEVVYVQDTVPSKKLRTEDDGTIIPSPIRSESFVS